MLNALEKFTPGTAVSVEIRTPRLYLRNSETNTQLIEDFADTIDLKWIIAGPLANSILTRPVAASIGREIGAWLRSFYIWAALPEQTDFLAQVAAIEPMRKMKYEVTYGSFIKILEDFPDLLEGHREALDAVVASTKKDFERPITDSDGQHWGLIHGDCWTGNVLVPNALWRDAQSPRKVEELFIIDWEYAQFGHRAYDLGNMVGDLYERKHFHGADGAMWAIEGLVEGYGGLDDELAFRTAIHAGVHLIYWYRRGPTPLERAPREKILGAMTAGRDFILKGWARDREWFEASPLRPLFAKK
ncbi:hypothetical protein GQ53DRAFT_150222 [Thozetella sp. PMI_491]|nr:hypothetical protein GQ53DRAFT_150222 [Thozetella sp. PMI_491]